MTTPATTGPHRTRSVIRPGVRRSSTVLVAMLVTPPVIDSEGPPDCPGRAPRRGRDKTPPHRCQIAARSSSRRLSATTSPLVDRLLLAVRGDGGGRRSDGGLRSGRTPP